MIWTIASIVTDVAGPRHRLQFVLPQAHVQSYWMGDVVSISDVDWFQAHLDQYRRDPARAHDWDATPVGGSGIIPTLLLRTVGAKTGALRELPLLYQPCGDGFVVVASRGGSPRHPGWYLNLLSNPNCSAQVGVIRYELAATKLTGQARQVYWDAMTRFWPAYLDYQARTDRTIPVVKLKVLAVSGPGPDPGA